MGMFDTILVPIRILPEITEQELEWLERGGEIDKGKISCQTKDFNLSLDVFEIGTNKKIYQVSECDWIDKEDKIDIEHFTGSFNFYTMVFEDNHRHIYNSEDKSLWLEWVAECVDGEVKSFSRNLDKYKHFTS